jgi:hypothetical protein
MSISRVIHGKRASVPGTQVAILAPLFRSFEYMSWVSISVRAVLTGRGWRIPRSCNNH